MVSRVVDKAPNLEVLSSSSVASFAGEALLSDSFSFSLGLALSTKPLASSGSSFLIYKHEICGGFYLA